MTESSSELKNMLINIREEIKIAEITLLERLASENPIEDLIPGNKELRQKIDRLRLEEGTIIAKIFVALCPFPPIGNS